MDEKRIEDTKSVSLKNILTVIKNNIVMIVLIVVLSAMCGLLYAYIIKPSYTATESVIYIATDDRKENQKNTESDISIMNAFFDTVVDFCTTGVVIDRANAYYADFMNRKYDNPSLKIEDYIAKISVSGDDPFSTGSSNITGQKYVVKENVITKVNSSTEDSARFYFTISYVDKNYDDSIYKVKLLVLAVNQEMHSDGLEYQGKYFSEINNQIISLGLSGVTPSVSQFKCVVISGIVGVLIAGLVIYLRSALDNTVRTKKTIEQLTGANVLAVLERERGDV